VQARLAGERLRALGVNMTLAPLADVDTLEGALSGRLFGTDPQAVARFSVEAVEGYRAASVISAVGHFPGAGAASADPDQMSATVGLTLAQLRGRDLVPFAAVAPLAPVIVMSNASYVAFDGVTPAGLLSEAVQLLRQDYGFTGVVMTDDLDATLDPTGSDPATVAVEALEAGDDLLYISGPASEHAAAYQGVLAAARRSAAVRALVRAALLRVLTLKARYGILPR
jgi:beta-N-acetylhexosaminidase